MMGPRQIRPRNRNLSKKAIPIIPEIPPISVLITAATGKTAESLIFLLAQGSGFGSDQRLILHLFDTFEKADDLKGIKLDLQDCIFPLVSDVIWYTDMEKAMQDISAAFLCDDIEQPPNSKTSTKQHLINSVELYRKYGMCLDKCAKKDIKVIVLGLPCSLNALICCRYAKTIPKKNFTALARYDQNRASSELTRYLDMHVKGVQKLAIWGNICGTRYVDARLASFTQDNGSLKRTWEILSDVSQLQWSILQTPTDSRKNGGMENTAMPIAKAACDQMRDWWLGTPPKTFVSMCVLSDGSYDIPPGIFFSFPVEIYKKEWKIFKEVTLGEKMKYQLEVAGNELLEASKEVFTLCDAIDGKVNSRQQRSRAASATAAAMIAASCKSNGLNAVNRAIKEKS